MTPTQYDSVFGAKKKYSAVRITLPFL